MSSTWTLETLERLGLSLEDILEECYISGERVEVVWKKGYLELFGYGLRTDGEVGRFYIGKSTGSEQIYVAVDNSRSWGGRALAVDQIESIRLLGKYRRKWRGK